MSDPDISAIDDDEAAERRTRRSAAIWRWALGVGIILAWEILTRLKIIDPYYFSSPTRIVSTAYVAATQGTLYVDIGYTSASTIVGFIIGVVAGALLGLSTWWSRVYGARQRAVPRYVQRHTKTRARAHSDHPVRHRFRVEGRASGSADDRSGSIGCVWRR